MIGVKRYQVVFEDLRRGTCFDEAFYKPSEAEIALDFLRPNPADDMCMVKARVFIHFDDGQIFELVKCLHELR